MHLSNAYIVHVEDYLRAPVDGRLRHSIRALLQRGERRIVLDLGRVSRIDAAGVGELVRAYNMATARNGAIRIVGASGRVRVILERVGLFVPLEGAEFTALRYVRPTLARSRDPRTVLCQ